MLGENLNGKQSTLELQHDRRRRRRLRQPNGIELCCDPMDSVVPDAVIEEGMKEGRKEAADDGGGGGGIIADDCHSAASGARKSK